MKFVFNIKTNRPFRNIVKMYHICDASQNLDNQFYQMDLIMDSSKLNNFNSNNNNSNTNHEHADQGIDKLNETSDESNSNRISVLGGHGNIIEQLKIANSNGSRFTAHNTSNTNNEQTSKSFHDLESRNSTKKIGKFLFFR